VYNVVQNIDDYTSLKRSVMDNLLRKFGKDDRHQEVVLDPLIKEEY
jgi:hypothetical protein